MNATHVLLVMLGTLLLLADGIAIKHVQPFPHPTAAILLGLVIGQIGLVASWAACARAKWWLRLAVTWLATLCAAGPLSLAAGPLWREWVALLLLYAMVVVVAWKLLLAAGYRWSLANDDRTDAPTALKPHQFSLGWLLQATTSTALALGVGTWLALPAHQPVLALASMAVLALFMPLAMSTLLVETRRWWLRGALLLILPLGAAVFWLMNRGATPMFLTLLLGVETLVALLTALVLASVDVSLVPVTESTTSDEPLLSLRLGDAL